ncbi:MAG TPA: RNA 3'-terminal phosphate cyclase [Candidatus Bilamarchaeum sp.]|nr:RNA 3'-terminal phosphate cyclase [Candidatus Bilamarchaeum sp.]
MIKIDGAYGEGGGQVIRTALTLSAITQTPVEIENIRANRPTPGLQPQHLMAAKAVRNICRGTLEGAEIGSRRLSFSPGPIIGGKYDFDIGTAGSVTLVAQTILPIFLRANKPSHARISGGTHVMKSPGYDYFENVFAPALGKFGIQLQCRMEKPGYYPRGGGVMEISIGPGPVSGCTDWASGDLVTKVIIRLSGLDDGIAIREKKIFVQNSIEKIFLRRDEALSVGNAITAWRGYRGSYVLGEKGKRAEAVAKEALDALNAETGQVDMHLADQLLIYAALAEGPTRFTTGSASLHLRTNAYVISKFLDRKIEIVENEISVS